MSVSHIRVKTYCTYYCANVHCSAVHYIYLPQCVYVLYIVITMHNHCYRLLCINVTILDTLLLYTCKCIQPYMSRAITAK